MSIQCVLKLCVLLVTLTFSSGLKSSFELVVLHLNDVHARFEETSVFSGRCSQEDKLNNRCYGGFARIHAEVERIRAAYPNVLFLSAGDYFQGTVWYTVHKWRAMAHFLNILNHDAMSFGNHEFDDGLAGIVPFLENTTFPVLGANIRDQREPSIQGKYNRSVVLERGGRKIGIIGYLTTETKMIAQSGRLDIFDEVEGVRQEAKLLKAAGVDIIIALGHAGYQRDIDVARNVEELDLVVGGHTNTFLYTKVNGKDPSTEPSVGPYPTVVNQASGRRVPVVQAYAFGKYLGFIKLSFDQQGNVVNWEGNPILLDNTKPQDPTILEELKPWRAQVSAQMKEEIGKTYVFLDGNRLSCRRQECNMGNMEADAIIHVNTKYPDDLKWARTSLAVVNGGSIRSSIDERTSNGTITMEDILTVAPFQNTIDIVELHGRHVKGMFEHSVQNYDIMGLNLRGEFLQVSGFVVVYDVHRPPGSRVIRLQTRCRTCRVPKMEDVQDDTVYYIAMPAYLANGGDGYTVVRDNKINHHLTGLLDTDAYVQYIQMMTPLYQGLENRILFIDSKEVCNGGEMVAASGSTKDGFGMSQVIAGGMYLNYPYNMTPQQIHDEMMKRHHEYHLQHYLPPPSPSSSPQPSSSSPSPPSLSTPPPLKLSPNSPSSSPSPSSPPPVTDISIVHDQFNEFSIKSIIGKPAVSIVKLQVNRIDTQPSTHQFSGLLGK